MVRVSSPVTEALAGSVTVIRGSLGCVSVSTIKDADPLGLVDPRELEPVEGDIVFEVGGPTGELEPVERDTVFEVDGPTRPPELVAVLETHVLVVFVETDDSGEVE